MHCTVLCSAHLYSYTLDPVELELKEPTEPAPAEEAANTELTEGKPRCIQPIILDFSWITTLCYICLCIKFIGVDWNCRCIMSTFRVILDNLASIGRRWSLLGTDIDSGRCRVVERPRVSDRSHIIFY
jgi:hypothetical protein